jgi:DNA polymerase-1
MKQAVLVDGSSVFFRAYHAIRELRRSDGVATNAVYGYVMTLRNLLTEYSPCDMIVAFDRPEPTFRKEKFEAYKANREEPPSDLIAQIPFIKRATETLGIPYVELAGYEADDLLGTLSAFLETQDYIITIVTMDKDLLQLVNDRVRVLKLSPMQNHKLYSDKEVEDRYGVKSSQLIDVLALMGDSSDNIPGVKGIGEKTAIQLIQDFRNLENIYENIDTIKGKKRKENLLNDKEMAFLSRELVTICIDAPIELHPNIANLSEPNVEELRDFYVEMEFRSLASALSDGTHAQSVEKAYKTVESLDELKEIVEQIQQQGSCAVDTETTSLDYMKARLVGISITINDHQGWYIPLRHSYGDNLSVEKTLSILRPVLESDSIQKIGHHIKYDSHVFANEGIQLNGKIDDTLIASYLSQPQRTSQKLDALAEDELGMRMTPITDLIGTGRNQKSMTEVDIEKASDYACEDTDATWMLWKVLQPKLNKFDLETLYQSIELPLMPVLMEMERKGIMVDSRVLHEQSNELQEELQTIENQIFKSVGREFNLNSPSQLAKILYDDLQILQGRKRSTRADILEKLANDGVAIASHVLDYRHRQKIKSTYLDALQKLLHSETNRVHTTYNQSAVNTGRISSTDPNLQNIPIRTDLGRRVRRAFVAPEGYDLISLDYSQIELRVLADISKDPGLQQAFLQGKDIHAHTASEIFRVAINDVTSDMRRKAKEINFGLNYGMSPYGLAKRLNIPDAEASQYIQAYFSRYPLVQNYMDETVSFAQEHLYVTTLLKRRIPTLGIRDGNRMRQDNARRAAINAPIQGSAADIMKKAMIDVNRELKQKNYDASILLTVHDELVIEVKDDQVEDVIQSCKEKMEHTIELSVPIPVEVAHGSNWAELK